MISRRRSPHYSPKRPDIEHGYLEKRVRNIIPLMARAYTARASHESLSQSQKKRVMKTPHDALFGSLDHLLASHKQPSTSLSRSSARDNWVLPPLFTTPRLSVPVSAWRSSLLLRPRSGRSGGRSLSPSWLLNRRCDAALWRDGSWAPAR